MTGGKKRPRAKAPAWPSTWLKEQQSEPAVSVILFADDARALSAIMLDEIARTSRQQHTYGGRYDALTQEYFRRYYRQLGRIGEAIDAALIIPPAERKS